MTQQRRTKKKVVKENVRRVVKWRVRDDYTPYLILVALLLIGIALALYKTMFR